ncbi:hypothetical protein [Aliikangiella maris]|uniref:Uncharacterized protein n=2 Tax=Aliikangiella maris TaxID=3162458 RepID=A0ABV3MR54_9GAMM
MKTNLFNTRKITIIVLSMFLVIYHIAKIFDVYWDQSTVEQTMLIHLQSIIRIFIVIALILVMRNKAYAVWGMWASISSLILTQYFVYFNDAQTTLSVFSYLKGFIIPSIITILCVYQKKAC